MYQRCILSAEFQFQSDMYGTDLMAMLIVQCHIVKWQC